MVLMTNSPNSHQPPALQESQTKVGIGKSMVLMTNSPSSHQPPGPQTGQATIEIGKTTVLLTNSPSSRRSQALKKAKRGRNWKIEGFADQLSETSPAAADDSTADRPTAPSDGEKKKGKRRLVDPNVFATKHLKSTKNPVVQEDRANYHKFDGRNVTFCMPRAILDEGVHGMAMSATVK